MKVKRFVFCLFMLTLMGGIYFISCGNTSKAKVESVATAEATDRPFQTFLKKFTLSASFRYTRVKFPLKTLITLMTDDGNSEKTFPFTQEKWPLLDGETLEEERVTQEEGETYVSKFTVNEPTHKEFEAGYEGSEVDLRVILDLIDGRWYVTDCYTGRYGYDLPIDGLNETVRQVKEKNQTFKELHPQRIWYQGGDHSGTPSLLKKRQITAPRYVGRLTSPCTGQDFTYRSKSFYVPR